MRLCVGAGSRRVVEEAAKLQVAQIVASRRQVDIGGGYIGLDQSSLVKLVRGLSGRRTQIVRDHGGPLQGGTQDDGIASFDADVAAGFDVLHIDVSALPREKQPRTLLGLIERYGSQIRFEIGGERDEQEWLSRLTRVVSSARYVLPETVVIEVGGHIWADRQCGFFQAPEKVETAIDWFHRNGIKVKAHNMDWAGCRNQYDDILDYYNIAPEFSDVEVRAILTVLDQDVAESVLHRAYASMKWRRWFGDDEGTWLERACCGVRYMLEELPVLTPSQETFVRSQIRAAIKRG